MLVLFALGLGAFLFIEVLPAQVTSPTNPSWIDDIFTNRVVLALVRVGLIAGAIYVGVSIVALIIEGRWLSEFGPAKVSKAKEPIGVLDSNVKVYESRLQDARDTIADLKQDIARSDNDLAKARADIEELLEQVATLEGTRGTENGP